MGGSSSPRGFGNPSRVFFVLSNHLLCLKEDKIRNILNAQSLECHQTLLDDSALLGIDGSAAVQYRSYSEY